MLEGILAMEEEHADDMANLLTNVFTQGPGPGERTGVHVEREGILLNHAARCSRALTPDRAGAWDGRCLWECVCQAWPR